MTFTKLEFKNITYRQSNIVHLVSNVVNGNLQTFDDSKRIRLKDVRKKRLTDGEMIELHQKWKSEDEYLILRQTKFGLKNKELNEIFACKCSKRGNDVYESRIRNAFRELDEVVNDMNDIGEIFDLHKSDKKTNVLYLTLSQDTKLCSSEEAWQQIGEKYNRFMTRMRKLYGKISVLRVWEAYANGYPHIHVILIFDFYSFAVVEHWNSDHTKSTFRLKNRSSFGRKWVDGDCQIPIDDRVNFNDTEEIWDSFVDIIAVYSIRGIVSYLSKYFRKSATNEGDSGSSSFKSDLTLAKTWFYGKKSFAMSGDFASSLKSVRLVRAVHNSNSKKIQLNLEGEEIPVKKCELIGICSKSEMIKCFSDGNPESWFLKLDRIPKCFESDKSDLSKMIERNCYSANCGVSIPPEDILNGVCN